MENLGSVSKSGSKGERDLGMKTERDCTTML